MEKRCNAHDAFLEEHARVYNALIHILGDDLWQVHRWSSINSSLYHLGISRRVVDVRNCGFEAGCFSNVCGSETLGESRIL